MQKDDITKLFLEMRNQMVAIDRVARIMERDVVFVSFEPQRETDDILRGEAPNHIYIDYAADENRLALIEWLNENQYDWSPVGHFASEGGWIAYSGNIYVDVPFDTENPVFQKLCDHLENPDGTPRNPRVKFWAVALEEALTNAHHDEPGFWERWAENF